MPRGEPADENVGTPFSVEADQIGVATSPLAPTAWQNRIAVPLEFSPVDTACRLGNDERQITGNELILSAIASWQPALCGAKQLPPFSYASVGDPTARRQLTSRSAGSPGLVAISSPVPESQTRPTSPIVYAPLAASGVVVGFNIERVPKPSAPAAAQEIAGVRVAELNLTPRLVAKLLSQSYLSAVQIIEKPPYTWVDKNPANIGVDPDFLQFNPEFALLGNSDRNFSSLTVPPGTSDAAKQLWEWVLSDPEARKWLDGEPDEWGMRVNPAYSTVASNNSSGFAFGDPVPALFPKADSYCYRPGAIGAQKDVVPPPLCATDWLPYARSFEEAATMTRAAYDRARIVLNSFAVNESAAWSRSEPQFLGFRTFLSVTDTSWAARYGLQTARLSRAGDNRPDRTFVGPTPEGLRAGVESMKARSNTAVLEPAVLDQGPAAYPLTTLTYAATSPLDLDSNARSDLAEFVKYAVTDGQVPGSAPGRLPAGYLPLTDGLKAQAVTAANTIVALQPTAPPAPAPTPETSTPTPVSTTASVPTATPSARRSSTRTVTTTPAAPVPESTPESSVPDTSIAVEVTDVEVPAEQPASVAVLTPGVDATPVRFAVPVLSGVALFSLLAALELTKRPRRSLTDAGAGSAEENRL